MAVPLQSQIDRIQNELARVRRQYQTLNQQIALLMRQRAELSLSMNNLDLQLETLYVADGYQATLSVEDNVRNYVARNLTQEFNRGNHPLLPWQLTNLGFPRFYNEWVTANGPPNRNEVQAVADEITDDIIALARTRRIDLSR